MFDRCRRWRRLLTQHAEGLLPDGKRAELQRHLALCERCHAAAEADQTLRDVLRLHRGMRTSREAHEFNETVLTRLRGTPAATPWGLSLKNWKASWIANTPFLQQVVSGAVFASSLTALCLFITLQSPPAGNRTQPQKAQLAPIATRNEPPVPLSALLQTPTPRAAHLWTAPANRDGERTPAAKRRPAAPRSQANTRNVS